MYSNTQLMVFAIMAMVGLVGVFAVELVPLVEQADAKGCRTSIAVNASEGRCFRG